MVIQERPGGGSLFHDYDGGYTIDIPAGWLAVKVDPEDIRAAMSKLGNTYSGLADAVKALLDAAPDTFRIFAYDVQPAHSVNGAIPNFNVALFPDRLSSSMPLELVIKANLDQIKTGLHGVKVKQLPTKSNLHKVLIGAAELEWTIKSQNGAQTALYEKQLYFQTKNALVVVTVTAPKTNAKVIAASFDELIDGIELIEP